MIKMEIRQFCIRFSKRLAMSKKSKEIDLLRKLNLLNALLDQNPSDRNLATEMERVKLALRKIAEHRTKGAIIRSRARWYEQGEKQQQIFYEFREALTLQKKHCKTKDL